MEAASNNGRTALHIAAYNNHLNIVKKLIEHGAKIDVVDKETRTALDLAAQECHMKVVSFLLTTFADSIIILDDPVSNIGQESEHLHQDIFCTT